MCLARKEDLRAYKYTRIKESKQKALKNAQTALLGLGPIINTVTDLKQTAKPKTDQKEACAQGWDENNTS